MSASLRVIRATVAGALACLLAAGCTGGVRVAPMPPAEPRTQPVPTAPVTPEPPPPAAVKPEAAAQPAATAPSEAARAPTQSATPSSSSPTPAAPPQPKAPAAAPAVPAVPAVAAAPPPVAVKPSPPPLNLDSLETRLRETKAIGVFTKVSLKNQVDDLLEKFRAYYGGQARPTLTELRRPYDLLLMKVLSLLQDTDPPLARDIVASREAIWGILADRKKFAEANLMAGETS